ncbi:hypothetical protein D3C71_2209130 [compost metagenome]
MVVENTQGLYFVFIGFQVFTEIVNQSFGFVHRFGVPFCFGHFIQIDMVDNLVVLFAYIVDMVVQLAIKS